MATLSTHSKMMEFRLMCFWYWSSLLESCHKNLNIYVFFHNIEFHNMELQLLPMQNSLCIILIIVVAWDKLGSCALRSAIRDFTQLYNLKVGFMHWMPFAFSHHALWPVSTPVCIKISDFRGAERAASNMGPNGARDWCGKANIWATMIGTNNTMGRGTGIRRLD